MKLSKLKLPVSHVISNVTNIILAISDTPILEGVNIKFLQKSVVIADHSRLFMDIL